MNSLTGSLNGAANERDTQKKIDALVKRLPDVLALGDHLKTLDWVSQYAQVIPKTADPEGINLRSDEIASQLRARGYDPEHEKGESNDPEKQALGVISTALWRIENGKTFTGFEPIIADRIQKEATDLEHSAGPD